MVTHATVHLCAKKMSASPSPQNSAAADTSLPLPPQQKTTSTILSETQISKHYHPHPSATPRPPDPRQHVTMQASQLCWKDRVRGRRAAEASRGVFFRLSSKKETRGQSQTALPISRIKGFQMQRFETHHKGGWQGGRRADVGRAHHRRAGGEEGIRKSSLPGLVFRPGGRSERRSVGRPVGDGPGSHSHRITSHRRLKVPHQIGQNEQSLKSKRGNRRRQPALPGDHDGARCAMLDRASGRWPLETWLCLHQTVAGVLHDARRVRKLGWNSGKLARQGKGGKKLSMGRHVGESELAVFEPQKAGPSETARPCSCGRAGEVD